MFAARAQGLQSVDRPSAEALFRLLEKTWWTMTAAQARSVAARHNVMTIQSLRDANNRRASSLKVALILQGFGLAAVVITIVQGIWSQPGG